MTIAESIQLNKEQIARAFGVPAHMLADPDHTAVPRYWSLCMTSENHGTVGPAGCKFSHAPEKHERVLVVEVPSPTGAPVDQVDLRLLTGTGATRPPVGQLVFRDSRQDATVDSAFLQWVHDRMRFVHGENENVDYMHKLRAIIASVPNDRKTPNVASAAQQAAAPGALPERDPSKPAEQQGLFRKFDVRRTDGSDQPGGKHHGCRYYVLDLTHDQHAPAAMRAYAAACASTHPQLAADIVAEFGAPGTPEAPKGSIGDLTEFHVLLNWYDNEASYGSLNEGRNKLTEYIDKWASQRAAQLDGGQEGSE